MNRSVLTGLITLGSLAAVAGIWLASDRLGGEGRAVPQAVSTAGAPPTSLAGPGPELAGIEEVSGGGETTQAAAPTRRSPGRGVPTVRGRWWAAPVGSYWVSGRVELPPGVPLDEDLWVEAEGARFENDPAGRRKRRERVDDDGTFRIAFSSKTRRGRIDVVARYLYLPDRWLVKFDSSGKPKEEIVLEPLLGGRVIARVLPPRSAAFSEDPLEGVEVVTSAGEAGWTTGVEGEWEIGGLEPEGGHIVIARSPLWADGRVSDVSVEPGGTTAIDVPLSLGVRLLGEVRDTGGQLVHGAQVTALTAEAARRRIPFMISNPLGAGTAAGGSFELRGIPPGDLVLVAERDGYLDAQFEVGELADGQERHGILLRLDRGGVVSGTVRWPGGVPAAGASVRISQGDTIERFELERIKGEVVVGADGYFEFGGLERETPCGLTASAIHPDDQPDPTSKVQRMLARRIPRWMARREGVMPGDQTLLLDLTPGDVLTGVVVDDAAEPIEAFKVTAFPARTGIFSANSMRPVRGRFRDSEGRFLLKGLQPGDWEVKVHAPGHAESERRPVRLPGAAPLRFVLARTATLSGVVYLPDGEVAARARVLVTHGGSGTTAATADQKGVFSVDGIDPGPIVAVADGEGQASSLPFETDLGPAERRGGVVLRLQPGARIVARVHPEAGTRSGRQVNLAGEGRQDAAQTGGDGQVQFDGLDAGKYSITLEPEEGSDFGGDPSDWLLRLARQKSVEVEVSPGRTAEVILGAPSPTAVRVRGTVRDGPDPVPRALVTASEEGGNARRPTAAARAGEDGRYELTLDRPGQWRFSVGAQLRDRVAWVEEVPAVETHELDFELPSTRLVGQITGPGGEVLRGLQVTLVDAQSDAADGDWQSRRFAATEEDGRFEFGSLRPGTYHLRAGGSDGWGFSEKGARYGRELVVVEVREGDGRIERDISLREAGKISGVLEEISGTPVAGARIRISDEEGRPYSPWDNVRTDAAGSFTCDGLAPGDHLVQAYLGAGEGRRESGKVEVRVHEGGTSSVLLRLE